MENVTTIHFNWGHDPLATLLLAAFSLMKSKSTLVFSSHHGMIA